MEKQASQMLKYIIKSCEKDGRLQYTALYDEYGKISGIGMYRQMACVRYLLEEGYINKAGDHFIYPNHSAYRKSAFTAEKVKNFLFRSIVLPIGISAATSLLTIWITGFFR